MKTEPAEENRTHGEGGKRLGLDIRGETAGAPQWSTAGSGDGGGEGMDSVLLSLKCF